MLVLDASAVAEVLLRQETAEELLALIADHDLAAPQLIVPEVVSVIRGWCLAGHVSAERGRAALDDFRDWQIDLHDMTALVPRAWELRSAVSAYDAMYVALAAALDCKLLTCDRKLARAVPERVVAP